MSLCLIRGVLAIACLPLPNTAASVLKGLDPVALTRGIELAGDPARTSEHDGYEYAFASDENKRRFESDRERFAIQLGGACARMGPLSGKCSQDRFAVHDGRIYVFASDACRASFLADPASHLDHDEPALEDAGFDRAAGRVWLDRVLAGLGGAVRVDAVKTLRWTKRAQQSSGGKSYATRETVMYRFPDELRRETAWDEWSSFDVDTPRGGFSGSKSAAELHPDGRRELRRQLGRDVVYLARQRQRADFDAAAAGAVTLDGVECGVLVVRCAGARTTLFVERESGRVVRSAFRGRADSGPNAAIVVDYSDFRAVGGLALPHARRISANGAVIAHMSGPVDELEVDVELAATLFTR